MSEESNQPKPGADGVPANPFVKSLLDGILAEPPAPDSQAEKWKWLFNPLWPEADWDVSGAFLYDVLLLRTHDRVESMTGRKPFSIVHGAPACLWNGGRGMSSENMKIEQVEQTIHGYADRRLAVELTFTNCNLNEERLKDPFSNATLAALERYNARRANGVILSEEILAKHVRANHPSLRLVASVVKITRENGRGNLDYYRSLEERYDKIMLHPDDNLNYPLLEKIEDKDRYTLLVNEPCIKGCQMRSRHYQLVSDGICCPFDSSINELEHKMITANGCNQMENLLFTDDKRTLVLSPDEIKRLYDMGFRHFKIQGRGLRKETAIFHEMSRLMFNLGNTADGHRVARLIQWILSGF